MLPRAGKPHGTVSAVSKLHCGADIGRVTKHDMLLHIMLQTMQICKEQILRRHQVTNFEHNCPEVLIILCDRHQLAQVKKLGLATQCMERIPKLSLQLCTKILPRTNPQLCPTFGSD